MSGALALALVVSVATWQGAKCKPGVVLGVEHGRDYTLTICDVGVVGLRGVEPPLRSAEGFPPKLGGPVSGEVLGDRNIGPEAVAFLSQLVGRSVTLVNDGYRIGDRSERQYAYVYLPDKTLLNGQMIRLGYGYADRQGSHPRRDEFIALEAVARRSKAGLWAGDRPQPVKPSVSP